MVSGKELILVTAAIVVAVAVGSVVFLNASGLRHSPPEVFVADLAPPDPPEHPSHPYNLTADDLAHLPSKAVTALDQAVAGEHARAELTPAERKDTETALHFKDAVNRGEGLRIVYRGTVLSWGFVTA